MNNENPQTGHEKIIFGERFLSYIFDITDIKEKMTSVTALRYILRAMLAGIIVSFGYVGYIVIDANFYEMGIGTFNFQALGHFFSGWFFGFCLVFIYYAKTELLTSNMMVLTVARYYKKITWSRALKILGLCLLGNFLGGLLVALFLANSTILTGVPHAVDKMNSILAVKEGYIQDTITNGFHILPLWDLFTRAVFCNFFINLPMIMVYSGNIKSDSVKSLVMFGGVFFFMYLGLEHSVANTVFFIVADFTKGTEFNVLYQVLNVLVVLVGNFVGGGIFIGYIYAFLNDKKQLKNVLKNQ